MGIEPTSEAWEASILPLYDARSEPNATKPAEVLQEFFAREFRVRVSVHVCKMGVFFCPFPVRPG
jgi:hypothetical protein